MLSFTRMRLLLIFLSLILPTAMMYAHGTEYEILSTGVIGIKASFDTGETMAGSRVLIFAPGETVPTFETKTDGNGIVCFAPDQAGLWILQVRDESGHGMRINLEVDDSMKLDVSGTAGYRSFSIWQRIVMAACVAVGFVGTALFFRRRKNDSDAEPG